jgi:hypothetical protein
MLGTLEGVPESDVDAAIDRAMRSALCTKSNHTINTNIRIAWSVDETRVEEPPHEGENEEPRRAAGPLLDEPYAPPSRRETEPAPDEPAPVSIEPGPVANGAAETEHA